MLNSQQRGTHSDSLLELVVFLMVYGCLWELLWHAEGSSFMASFRMVLGHALPIMSRDADVNFSSMFTCTKSCKKNHRCLKTVRTCSIVPIWSCCGHWKPNLQKYPLVIWHSYWKLPFIVDFPIKNGGSFHSYVNVYQRVFNNWKKIIKDDLKLDIQDHWISKIG